MLKLRGFNRCTPQESKFDHLELFSLKREPSQPVRWFVKSSRFISGLLHVYQLESACKF